MRDPKERLLDMLDAIERIEKYVSKGRAAFEQDELIQTWVVHHGPPPSDYGRGGGKGWT